MHVHVGGQNIRSPYFMEDNKLTVDETEKDFGIWIASDMKCSDQCLYAFNKASKVMGMIRRTIKYKEAKICLLYTSPSPRD